MVPEGWEQFTLGEFMDFKNGLNTDKSQYGSGIKFVNVMDVFGNDFLTQEIIVGRVQVPEKKLQENLLQYGDILLNRTSETFDEIAMSSTYLDSAPATFGGFVIRGRDRKNKLLPNFSVYAFQSSLFRQQVIRLGQGAVRANIGQKDLSKVILPVPPKAEQKKIAQILSTWDKAITTTEQLLANSQQQKKALMQQLLTGKKRLLDDNGVRFSGEWQYVNFGNVVNVFGGNAFKSNEFAQYGVPIIRISNIKADYSINMESSIKVPENKLFERFKVSHGDILIAMSGATTGKVGKYTFETFSYLNQRVGKFEPIEGRICKEYLFQLLKSPRIQHDIVIDAAGGAQPNISSKNIERIKLKLPSSDEQKKSQIFFLQLIKT